MNMATHEVAQGVPERFRRLKLAPPSAQINPLDRRYPHTDGPYAAFFSRDDQCWHVSWDGWSREPLLRFDCEADAAEAVRDLAALWRPTAGRKVYFIGTENREGRHVKIGLAFDPEKRLRALQTGHSQRLRVLAWLRGEREDEARLHRKFYRTRVQGEWFRITPALKRMIQDHAPEMPAQTLSPPIWRH
jgi:hypothetical protein